MRPAIPRGPSSAFVHPGVAQLRVDGTKQHLEVVNSPSTSAQANMICVSVYQGGTYCPVLTQTGAPSGHPPAGCAVLDSLVSAVLQVQEDRRTSGQGDGGNPSASAMSGAMKAVLAVVGSLLGLAAGVFYFARCRQHHPRTRIDDPLLTHHDEGTYSPPAPGMIEMHNARA